ncbi:TIGR02300 family protein [Rhodovibrionaceae bacterium A322]
MAKPEWGTKCVCQSCSTKFYDLKRDPAVCPSCGTTYNSDAALRKRAKASKVVKKDAIEEVVEEEIAEVDVDLEDDIEVEGDSQDDDVTLEDDGDISSEDLGISAGLNEDEKET